LSAIEKGIHGATAMPPGILEIGVNPGGRSDHRSVVRNQGRIGGFVGSLHDVTKKLIPA
jgi:hypothetical protein